jgi:hypothetical protein
MDLKSARVLSLSLLAFLVSGAVALLARQVLPEDDFILVAEQGGVRYQTPARPFAYSWYLSVACRPDALDHIYVLTDAAIDETYVGNRAVLAGLLNHLARDAEAIGWAPVIETVTIAQMRAVLESGQPAVLIDALGYWPDEIPPSTLERWLGAGGILVWLGDRFGAWLWTADGPQPAEQPLDEQLWGRSLYDPHALPRAATVPLPAEQHAGLVYWLALSGPSPAIVSELGGRAMGWQTPDGQRVSHAVVPLGRGSVVIFGSRLVRIRGLASEVAQDLVNILYRGLTDPHALLRAGSSTGTAASGLEPVEPGCPEARAVIGSSEPWIFRLTSASLGTTSTLGHPEQDRE